MFWLYEISKLNRKQVIKRIKNNHIWISTLPFLFGCIPELTKDCLDMTNASSTYLGIAGGAAIGGIITWWVYYRQKKIAEIQDFTLKRIEELDENHDIILKTI